jgi:Na+/H+-dicarboxylate symporter
VLWSLLIAAGFAFLGPRIFKLLVLIKEAFLLSFATASSEAAYRRSSMRSIASASSARSRAS